MVRYLNIRTLIGVLLQWMIFFMNYFTLKSFHNHKTHVHLQNTNWKVQDLNLCIEGLIVCSHQTQTIAFHALYYLREKLLIFMWVMQKTCDGECLYASRPVKQQLFAWISRLNWSFNLHWRRNWRMFATIATTDSQYLHCLPQWFASICIFALTLNRIYSTT